MNLNNIIFPAPKNFNIPLGNYADELIFIPRTNAHKTPKTTPKTKPYPNKKNSYLKFDKLSDTEKKHFLDKRAKSPKQNTTKNFNLFNKNKKNIETNNYQKLTEEKLLANEEEKDAKTLLSKKNQSDDPEDYIPCLLLLLKDSRNKSASLLHRNQSKFCVFFHGNAEDIFLAREFAEKLRESLDRNILLVEYPGYSIYFDEKSSDKILENSLLIFDFLTEEVGVDPQDVMIMGRSIGTAPASYLASKRPVAALVLLSAFVSIRAVAESLIGRFLKFIVSERFEIIRYIAEVNNPVLFIHGQKDDMIPFQHTLKLKEECKAPFEVLLPEEMDHNDFDFCEHLVDPLKAFLKRHVATEAHEDKDGKNMGSRCNRGISLPNRFYLVPFCVLKMIKLVDEEHNKPSVFACFGV